MKILSKYPNLPRQIIYFETVKGLTNPHGETSRVYYGTTFSITKEEYENHESSTVKVEQLISDALEKLAQENNDCEPDNEGLIEIHETYDMNSNKILFLLKVPFKKKS